jgi:hypothetical protein
VKRQNIISLSLSIMLVLSLFIPTAALASVSQKYPKEVNGLPVIYIQTPTNTVGLSQGQIRIVLYDSVDNSSEESIDRLNLGKYLASNPVTLPHH